MSVELTTELLQAFLIERGGKVTNNMLVDQFHAFLTDGKRNRQAFTNMVNKIATVSKTKDGIKIITLKDKYLNPMSTFYTESDGSRQVPSSESPESGLTTAETSVSSEGNGDQSPGFDSGDGPASQVVSESDPPPADEAEDTKQSVTDEKENESASIASTADSVENDQPIVDDTSEVFEVKMAAKPIDTPDSKRVKTVADPAQRSSVRERAQMLNRQETDHKIAKAGMRPLSQRQHACEKESCEDVMHTDLSLDETKRKWLSISSKCSYHEMARLLQDYPKLANWRNFINGYTALHFAAKFGDSSCVKLLAGTYKANPNIQNHAGHTTLHIAAMNGQVEVFKLLISVYGAKQNIFDYSGLTPMDYMKRQMQDIGGLELYLYDTMKRKKLEYMAPPSVHFATVDAAAEASKDKRRGSNNQPSPGIIIPSGSLQGAVLAGPATPSVSVVSPVVQETEFSKKVTESFRLKREVASQPTSSNIETKRSFSMPRSSSIVEGSPNQRRKHVKTPKRPGVQPVAEEGSSTVDDSDVKS